MLRKTIEDVIHILSEDEELKELFQTKDLSKLITVNPQVNATKLNDTLGTNSFINLSMNRITNMQSEAVYALKVGIATTISINGDNNILNLLDIHDKVIEVLIKSGNSFKGDYIEFIESAETYFTSNKDIWGYVMIFQLLGEPYDAQG